LEEAKELTLKGIDLFEKTKIFRLAAVTNGFLGEICFAMRQYQASQKHWQRAIAILRDNPTYPSQMNSTKLAILKANLMNDMNIDLESMYALSNEIKLQVDESEAQKHIIETLLVSDESHIAEAEDWIKRAIEFNKRNGMRFYLGTDYVLYSELFKRKEDIPKIKETLTKAIDVFKECGADGWVEKYEKELASLS